MFFYQRVKEIQWGKNNYFNNGARIMRHPNAKKKAIIIILNLYSIPYIRVNSKGITNLNVKDETIKNFTGTIRENIFEIVLGKDFLNVKLKS